MPLDSAGALIPRATIEQIVAHRDRAIGLYGDAIDAIQRADAAIKAAQAEAELAAPGLGMDRFAYDRQQEIEAFYSAVKLPNRAQYLRTARQLVDLNVWRWVIQYTDLGRLMDKEAKDKLDQQMRYVPTRVDPDSRQLITGEEIEAGMPPVTVENIYATLQQFALDAESIFRRGVANVFSGLDRRFKSHDGFKIGSRVILTYFFSRDSGMTNYRERDTLLDVERAFVVLDGKPTGYIGQASYAIDQARHGSWGPRQDTIETEYFLIRCYKNGNAHLWFRRDDLVRKVNKLLAEWYGEVIGDGQTADPDIFADTIKTTPAKRYGFFPTPEPAAAKVIEAAHLYRLDGEPPLSILEPSAGTGNLARLCATAAEPGGWEWRDGGGRAELPGKPYGHQVDCVEIQPALAADLEAEGIYRRVVCADFMQLRPDPVRLYDRVVMNPPFDRERDIDHVVRAFDFLKPDGQLVAIMSAGTEFRETKKAGAFRELMREMGGRFHDLPAGSFSSVGTNVNTMLVTVWKNGAGRQGWNGRRFEP
jgi:hypothetical protein